MNPIKSIDGVELVHCPSSYVWKLSDITADSGWTEDVVMNKKRLGQEKSVDLSWNNITSEAARAILRMFNPEYITVEYLDPMEGDFQTAEFYVSDRSAPLYNSEKDVWSNVSFSIIKRAGVD